MTQIETLAAAATEPAPASQARSKRRCAIRIRGLEHYFGEGELRKQALFDNHLEVTPGEIVIMTGPSGSGKTTLLTLIGTLRTVQEGNVEVLGHQLHGATPEERIAVRRKLGFIFQHHNLFASLTAMQNVKMGLELFDLPPREMEARAADILTRLGLGKRIQYKPDELSGGQKQRVAIARALAHHPQLVLADEPTAALDEKSGREVVTLFQELARNEQCTILMVTHDNRILDIADRIVNMIDGHIKSSVLVQESALICEFLRQCYLFRELTPRTLTYVADQMKLEMHAGGAEIIKQGEAGNKFYVIRNGTVDVLRDGKWTASLGPGEFFGEVALIQKAPRNATVVAKQDVELYALGKKEFEAVIMASAPFEEELRKALFARH